MKRLFLTSVFLGLLSSTSFAAGQMGSMTGVSQEINIEDANIQTQAGSNGGGASGSLTGKGSAGFEKVPGQIDIAVIRNSGGEMSGVSQIINAKKATISSNGAPIGIGQISNE